MKRLLQLCHGLSWLLFSVCSQAAVVDDVRIVIDVSGSMVETDPQNLRVPALRMLNGMIPTGANAGVWTFGRYTNMEVKWGTVNQRWRELADQGAGKIHSRGQFTDIERALQRATNDWDKADPNSRRNLILLTDGRVDISKNQDLNVASRIKILNQLIPGLQENGVKVHSIALSSEADEALLKQMARTTSGSFEIANSAEDLQRIFLRMFERATKPDTVPLVDNQFTIDKSVREMTLLVFRNSDQVTRLIEPDQQAHSEHQHGAQVNWRNDQGYDLITVTKPRPGVWALDADMDPDNRVMIVTDLKLVVDELPAYSTPDQALDIKVELHSQNKKISKNSFLKFVDFSLVHEAEGKTETLPLNLKPSRTVKDKGIYLQQLAAPLSEGKHEVIVQADARTFSRSKRYTIDVQWPVTVDIQSTRQPGIFSLNLAPRQEYIKPESLQLTVNLQQPDGQQQPLQLIQAGNQWSTEIPANQQDGLHQLLISLQAQTLDDLAVAHELTPYSVFGVKQAPAAESEVEPAAVNAEADVAPEPAEIISPEQEDTTNWLQAIIIFSVVNLVLILLGVGLYLWMRKNNQLGEIELVEAQQDKVAEA
ncbi:MAG: vWA domain-containing protein [Gammaproteobacteria bacterium]|nr:vWA domain-containing protein [Gammaproteobacteria bacterium]